MLVMVCLGFDLGGQRIGCLKTKNCGGRASEHSGVIVGCRMAGSRVPPSRHLDKARKEKRDGRSRLCPDSHRFEDSAPFEGRDLVHGSLRLKEGESRPQQRRHVDGRNVVRHDEQEVAVLFENRSQRRSLAARIPQESKVVVIR